jgi:putative ABC transport system permease protein
MRSMLDTIAARVRSLIARLVGVFRSRRVESDLRDELQSHIDMRTELLIARGASPRAARLEALRQFGNRTLVQEEARRQELLPRLESVVQDLQYGVRLLRRNPGFTAIALLTLGLGIGLNTAMFSVFHHTLLAPLQFSDSDRLYVVSSHALSLGDTRRASSGPDFRDYRAQNTVFTGVAAVIPRFSEVWTGDGEPRVVTAASPTVEFFAVMGVRPALGRLFLPNEFHDLHNETLIISWKFWKNQLGGDPHVVGRVIHIEDVPSVIVGVLPPMTDVYSDVDIWLKLTTEPSWPFMDWRANKFLDVVGRLRPGVDPRVAEEQLTTILRRAVGEPADVRVQLTPLREFVVGSVSRQLAIMMGAVAVVLLVTLLNTAALLLARSVKRAPELAVRLGLGASRARIQRQLLVEGLLLSAIGGACGVALAFIAVGFVRQMPGVAIPRIDGLHVDGAAITITVVVVVLTSAVFALLPGALLRPDLATAFRGGRTETGRAQRPFAALVVAEVACAVVLAICAGLLVRSSLRLQAVNTGYQPERVLSAYLRTNYDNTDGYPFWRSVLDASANVPGATSSAVSDCVPSSRANAATLLFADRANVRGQEPSTEACWISADYFRTLGAPLVRGRYFTDHDELQSPLVAIVNAEAARRLFPGANPIGKRVVVNYLSLGSRMIDSVRRWREIVGVVSNLRQRAVDLPAGPAVYLPYTQDETFHVLNSMHLYVRSASVDPAALGRGIRTKIQAMYPNQPVEDIRVMQQVIALSMARRTYAVELMAGFAGLALLLCGLGIYGIVSYAMQQRTREFGIRMALGAQRGNVLGQVLQQGGRLIGAGVVVGVLGAFPATRTLAQLLFETAVADPVVYVAAVAVLGVTGMAACLLPAIRASRLDPRAALNEQ